MNNEGFKPTKYGLYPKYPDPSKLAILRTRTPAIQVQAPPLEGPRILRVTSKKWRKRGFPWEMSLQKTMPPPLTFSSINLTGFYTPLKFNSSALKKWPLPNRKGGSSSNHRFVGASGKNFRGVHHLSHEKKNLLLSMKYWLVNRDPYCGLL